MALITDNVVITIDDLLELESTLTQTVSGLGIDVTTKINLAISGVSDKVMLWLLNGFSSDPQWLTRRQLGLSTVVVTPSLRKWLCFEALSRCYAEAYNAQLNTRYQGKWTEYQQEAKKASEVFFQTGVGIVAAALPQPQTPLISIQSGSSPAQDILVQSTWVDQSGAESSLSPPASASLPLNSSIAVAMEEGALGAPAAAAGWNVYLGTNASSLTLQNVAPLAIGSTWELPQSGLQIGASPGGGQEPTYYVALSRRILRG